MPKIKMHVYGDHSLEVGVPGVLKGPGGRERREEAPGWVVTPSMAEVFSFQEFELDDLPPLPAGEEVSGYRVKDNKLERVLRPRPITELTAHQLIMGLAETGVMSRGECAKFAKTGDLPTKVLNAIPGDADQKAMIEIALAKKTRFRRDDPAVVAFATAAGMTPEALDNLFRVYANR